jgi:hypothetical protein
MKIGSWISRLNHWETWHYLAKYIPIMPVWLWYCVRAKSLWFFTPSNPTITFGGFEGEGKWEIYKQLPPHSYPKTILVSNTICMSDLHNLLAANGFVYPFAVKPNIGMMGFMFRTMRDANQLESYHAQMSCDYLVQELVTYPLEVSVFYYRYPGSLSGNITGFIRKEYLSVTGDGHSTLEQLIDRYPRACYREQEIKSKNRKRLNEVITAGETCVLSHALNLSRGGRLVSLAHEKDQMLLKVFDDLSNYAGHFYYGRYDIKCSSIGDLKKGINYKILEYNGCGAEPHHVYGNGNTLFQAYRILLHHWKILYNISRANYKNGVKYWAFPEGFKFLRQAKQHFRRLKQVDLKTQL